MSRSRRRRRKRTNRGRTPGLPRWARGSAIAAAAVTGLLLVGLVWMWPRCSGDRCPSVENLREYVPPQASRVYAADGGLISQLAPERRVLLPLDEVPDHVRDAFLAVEDQRFYRHRGIDTRRVVGALLRNLRNLRFDEGFSTITMQLTRNVFPEHLSREKTIRRKLWEVVLATRIERAFTKNEILELYLNQIYLGDGAYGVEAAAQTYFGASVVDLDLSQAALLAALPRAPNFYNPRNRPERAAQRRNLVLGLMAAQERISAEEAASAASREIELVAPFGARGTAPYFVAAVRRELRERFGPDADVAGLRVFTGLDPRLQEAAETALTAQLEAIEGGHLGRYLHPACAEMNGSEGCLQGMFVALDPWTGEVRALVGGRDFGSSQFDRASQGRRQAGSAFKPFAFAAAIESGMPISTALLGPEAASYEGTYRPADHVAVDEHVDLREAMRMSSNRAAVVLGDRVGLPAVVRTARAMGIGTPVPEYPSTILGAAEVVPIHLVAAFAPFGTGGRASEPRLIQRVENGRGEIIWQASGEPAQVLSPGAAYLTLDLMRGAVDRGTGAAVRRFLPARIPAAGKTGTTNDAADVWFVGLTPDLVAGVWMGFDRPGRIMQGGTGGRLAAPVWGRIMAEYYEGREPSRSWTPPPDVLQVEIDRHTGALPTANCPEEDLTSEWFIQGTEPTSYCRLHPEASVRGFVRRAVRTIEGWFGRGD